MKDLSQNMSNIFDKLNDLKNVFKFGEKIVPIIQSLTEFMREIVPLLENINVSIADSTKKMPQAQNQISNVTNATELATTEILDLADKITSNLFESEALLKNIQSKRNSKIEITKKIKDLLKNNSEALELINEFERVDDFENEFQKASNILNSIKDDVYQITLSLQVQDITAQQLASVNHLIESVQQRLTSLVADIQESDLNEEIKNLKIDVPEGVTFDPNASYTNKAEHQKKIDAIISERTSQEEIDKLFG